MATKPKVDKSNWTLAQWSARRTIRLFSMIKKMSIILTCSLLLGCAYPYPYGYYSTPYVQPYWAPPPVQVIPPCNSRIVPIYDYWGNVVGRRFVC